MVLNRRKFIKYSIISSLVPYTGGFISKVYASDTNISLSSLNAGLESDILLIIDVQNDFCPGGSLGVKDGDKIIIDGDKGIINVDVTEEEFSKRKESWKPRGTDYNSGTLWKYSQTVGSAQKGAITHPGADEETHVYADI